MPDSPTAVSALKQMLVWGLLGIEELKFIRSPRDLPILIRKGEYVTQKMALRLTSSLAFPQSLQIEPTNACNLRCICCSSQRSFRKRGLMSMDLFQKIIQDARDCRIRRIQVFCHGEPTLHPCLPDMLAFIKKMGLTYHLTTNAMRLDPEMSRAVLAAGGTWEDTMTVSVLGGNPAEHERVMAGCDHERVLGNVRSLFDLRRELHLNGPVIETILYRIPGEAPDIAEYRRTWKPVVDHTRLGGETSESYAQYKKGEPPVFYRSAPCTHLLGRMVVYWDGTVPMCGQDVDGERAMGNLREQRIAQVWQSAAMLQLRRLHHQKKFDQLPFCAQCDW